MIKRTLEVVDSVLFGCYNTQKMENAAQKIMQYA